jgi:hypothetical protein
MIKKELDALIRQTLSVALITLPGRRQHLFSIIPGDTFKGPTLYYSLGRFFANDTATESIGDIARAANLDPVELVSLTSEDESYRPLHEHLIRVLAARQTAAQAAGEDVVRWAVAIAKISESPPIDSPQNLGKDHESPRIKTMEELLGTDFRPIRWVVPPILPEGLAILSGPPKIGKSWLVMNLCLASATGGLVFGKFRVDPGEVLLLSLEDNERRLQGRLRKCLNGARHDLSKFHATTTWRRLDKGGLADLKSWLEQHAGCKVVVIDTIQKIKPHARKNSNAYESDYDIYGCLQQLALEFCCCILVIHHNRKSVSNNDDDPLEQISGSTGITGSMDTILMLRRPRGASGAVLTATGRDIPEAELCMEFNGDSGQWVVTDGQAAELTLGDNNKDILEVMKANKGQALGVVQIHELMEDKTPLASLKTKLYRMVRKGLLNVYKGKFLYIDNVTGVTSVTESGAVTAVTGGVTSNIGNMVTNGNSIQTFDEGDFNFEGVSP